MNNSTSDKPIVPSKLEDLSSTWVSKILGEKISDEAFEIETNAQSGSGFLSNMTRIRCKSATKSYNLIVKLLPDDENMRALVISEKFDNTELNFYQTVMPDLIQILPELEGYLCHFYYGQIQNEDSTSGREYGSVIVLEDLKPQGYYTINFAAEETPQQINEVISFLAKFHLASMVLEEKKGIPLDKVYDFVQGVDVTEDSLLYAMGHRGFAEVIRVLGEHGGNTEVRDTYQELAPHLDSIIKKVLDASRQYPCLIHGDLWSNNLLFNDNLDFQTKVIDWQLLGYRDPTMDLTVTIISSLPMDKLTKENVDELMKGYFKLVVEQAEAKGVSQLVKRDLKEFSKFFYTWGMSFAFLWVLMSSDTFAVNIPRSIKIFEFLITEMKVEKFILSEIVM